MKTLVSMGFLALVTMTGATFAADVPINASYASTGGVSVADGSSAVPVAFGIIMPGPTELSGTRLRGSGSLSGAIAGGQIGFNWQAGMFVFGERSTASGRGSRAPLRLPAGPNAPQRKMCS
jgi:hypothetical protein